MSIFDSAKFFGKYLQAPRFTGAVCPSSRFLARKMAKLAKISGDGIVVELGPGTGPVTKALLESGVKAENLYSIEFDSALSESLKKRFPKVNVVNDSAENISKILGQNSKSIRAIVSSLPLLSLPKDCVENILNEVENILPRGGTFVQFTYQLNRNPDKLGFKKLKPSARSIVLLNIPPARVDAFEKL